MKAVTQQWCTKSDILQICTVTNHIVGRSTTFSLSQSTESLEMQNNKVEILN